MKYKSYKHEILKITCVAIHAIIFPCYYMLLKITYSILKSSGNLMNLLIQIADRHISIG